MDDHQSSHSLRLAEKRFGELGKELSTADVFQRVVRSRKGKERAIGEVWLDGQTVCLPEVPMARLTPY